MTKSTDRTPIHPGRPRVLIHARGRLDEAECGFWLRLRCALRDRGADLLLIAHHRPQVPLDVPVLTVPNMLHSPPIPDRDCGWRAWWPDAPRSDDHELLERERAWRGSDRDDAHERRRRTGLRFYRSFYEEAVHRARPSLALIWNGTHAQEMVLDRVCRAAGFPVLYIERGPLPGTIHVDPDGILAASRVAGRPAWSWHDESSRASWRAQFERLRSSITRDERTWWSQPTGDDADGFRQRHGIKPNDLVLLFAGQVDRDAQNLFFSDRFESNIEAFEWFLSRLPEDRQDLFVLGKHHPKSDTPPEQFRAVLDRASSNAAWRGVWTESLDIGSALSLADRVAAVNSTVLFEGLLRDRPVCMLGKGLLSGKGIAHEPKGHERAEVARWLAGEGAALRSERFRDFGAYLLANELFDFTLNDAALRGPESLAGVLVGALGRRDPAWPHLTSDPPLLEHTHEPTPGGPGVSADAERGAPDAFLIASPRSGTTWLLTALNAHPDAACVEQRLFGNHADFVHDSGGASARLRVTLDRYVEAISQHLAPGVALGTERRSQLLRAQSASTIGLVREWTGAQTVIDKVTPYVGTASMVFDRVRECFPASQILHLVRDGRDVAVSGVMHWLTKSIDGGADTAERELRRRWLLRGDEQPEIERFFLEGEIEEWASTWAEPTRAALARPNRVRMALVRYEEMLDSAEQTLQRVFKHLGLDSGEDVARECAEASSFRRMSGGRARGDDKPGEHVRNGVAGDWRTWFTRRDGRLFDELAGDVLRELGYVDDECWWESLPETIAAEHPAGSTSRA